MNNGFLLLFYPLDAHEKRSGRDFRPTRYNSDCFRTEHLIEC
jgi:hypothetical protein